MKNRIKELRIKMGMSLAKLEELTDISAQQLNRLEKGERRLNDDNIKALCDAFHISPRLLFDDPDAVMIPILGYVGAGAEVFPIDDHAKGAAQEEVECPPGIIDVATTVALRVKGDSMMPFMPSGTIVYYSERMESGENYLNKLCVVKVKDGPTLLKILKKGYTKGHYNLMSYNADMIEDVRLEWCGKIIFIKPV